MQRLWNGLSRVAARLCLQIFASSKVSLWIQPSDLPLGLFKKSEATLAALTIWMKYWLVSSKTVDDTDKKE